MTENEALQHAGRLLRHMVEGGIITITYASIGPPLDGEIAYLHRSPDPNPDLYLVEVGEEGVAALKQLMP